MYHCTIAGSCENVGHPVEDHFADASKMYVRYQVSGKLDSVIAAISIGYADGLNRHLGNRHCYCLVNGQKADYVGNICMDVALIDVTDIPCKEGDQVEIFGENLPVTVLSDVLPLLYVSVYLCSNVASQYGTITYTELDCGTERVVGTDDHSILVYGVRRGHVLRHYALQTAEFQLLAGDNRDVMVGIEQDEGGEFVGPRGIQYHHAVGLAVPLFRLLHSGVGHPWNSRPFLALDDEVGKGGDDQQ